MRPPTLAAAGLSALVMRSSQLFTAVRLAGAGYLVALGLWTLWSSRRRPAAAAGTGPARRLPRTGRASYPQALLGNVLNPKAASIFLTLVPQFVDPRLPLLPQIAVLATAMAALITTWLLLWTVVLGRAARTVRTPRVRTALRRLTAAVLIALGLRAATT
jgi:threonine/homoserine/homoserine lactone efflux protein